MIYDREVYHYLMLHFPITLFIVGYMFDLFSFYKNDLNMEKYGFARKAMESFVLRYKNVVMAGPHYRMFMPARLKRAPFFLNTRIYSCNLIKNRFNCCQ